MLKSLILEDFCLTFGLSEHYLPIYVGVHLVTVSCANNDLPGFSSPDCFHQDGETFTFAHLVQRNSNAGGVNNYIGKIKCRNKKLTEISKEDIIDSFVLKKFLESFAVYDNAVSHYVDHLIKIDPTGEPAQRTMILIDFSLTKQNI